MPFVKSQIDTRIATTSGHVFLLKAGEPTNIPDECVQVAYMRGCIPVSADAPPPSPEVRAQAEPNDEFTLDDAVRLIIEDNDPAKLKTDGTPKVVSVRELLSFDVSVEEVAEAFGRVAPTTKVFRAKVLGE